MTVFIVRPDLSGDKACGVLLRPGQTLQIGRDSDNDISFPDMRLSRRHFEIRHDGDCVRVWDTTSHCGTYVNGEQIRQDVVLRPGDHVGIPRTYVCLEDAPIVNSLWLSSADGAVRDLASVIHKCHSLHLLPLFADALEDAACTDAEILGHLRGPGPHVRGCWALDLVVGKS
jgi:hypothetical protein